MLEVGRAVLLVVGERGTDDVKFLILNVFIERLAEEVLDGVGNKRVLVHALDEAEGSHTLAETGHGGFLLIVFQLLGYFFGVVVFGDFNLDLQIQIIQIFPCNVHVDNILY